LSIDYQANWNLVSLQITPEPATTTLIFLGAGFSFFRCHRMKPHA
jgi:hypothetical protein